MAKPDINELDGVITETLPNAMFRVQLDNGHLATVTIAGRLRVRSSKILPGDRVTMEFTPYDPSRGRIIARR